MRPIDADRIVEVAKHAWNEWNLAMATQDTNRGVNKVLKKQELCKAVEGVADACPTIDPESLRPQWIPVTQRLPDAEEEVLAFCKCGKGGYVCEAFFIPKGTYREESGYCFEWECCKEYNEERDDYEINPGWYERIYNWDEYGCVAIHDMVTHWMPIPKAPESDGDADDIR